MTTGTMSIAARLGAWAELTRISNLPTAWSNTLVGCLLACGTVAATNNTGTEAITVAPGWWMAWPIVGATLLYLSGMAMNDAIDAGHDADHRGSRPIPSGRVGLRSAALFAKVTLFGGIAACFVGSVLSGVMAACLGGAILAYNTSHKKTPWSVVPMGLCRGLLPLVGAAAAPEQAGFLAFDAWFAGVALFGYTLMLTLAARNEDIPGARPALLVTSIVILPVLGVLGLYPLLSERSVARTALGAPVLALLVWHARSVWLTRRTPPKVIHAVMGWLAGLCLVDLLMLRALGDVPGEWSLVILACFMLTAFAHRRLLGS